MVLRKQAQNFSSHSLTKYTRQQGKALGNLIQGTSANMRRLLLGQWPLLHPYVPEDFLPTSLPGWCKCWFHCGTSNSGWTVLCLPLCPLLNLHGAELLWIYSGLLVGDFKVVI